MRKQIAAANWKMNLNLNEAESLVNDILNRDYDLNDYRIVLMAVPFPYLINIQNLLKDKSNFFFFLFLYFITPRRAGEEKRTRGITWKENSSFFFLLPICMSSH